MSDGGKSFEQLVSEAPQAPQGGTVSLVGALSRAAEEGKFVLETGDGRSMTLDTAAVTGHAVLGSSVGKAIVRVDLDPAKLPSASADQASQQQIFKPLADPTLATNDQPFTIANFDHPFTVAIHDLTIAWLDHHGSNPLIEQVTTGLADIGPINTLMEGAGTVAEGAADPGSIVGQPAINTLSPFGVAAPHQVPAALLAQMGMGNVAAPNAAFARTGKVPHFDKLPHHDSKWLNDVLSGATNPGGRFLD